MSNFNNDLPNPEAIMDFARRERARVLALLLRKAVRAIAGLFGITAATDAAKSETINVPANGNKIESPKLAA